jgi:hypothetical protein
MHKFSNIFMRKCVKKRKMTREMREREEMHNVSLIIALTDHDLTGIKQAIELGANPNSLEVIKRLEGTTPSGIVKEIEKEKWKELLEIVNTIFNNKEDIVITNDRVEVPGSIKWLVTRRLKNVTNDIVTIEEIKDLLQKFPNIRESFYKKSFQK